MTTRICSSNHNSWCCYNSTAQCLPCKSCMLFKESRWFCF